MAFTPMTEYRLVVGVLGITFDEDSASEAKRQFDLFVIQSKTARSARRLERPLVRQYQGVVKDDYRKYFSTF